MSSVWQTVTENLVFVLQFLGLVAAIFLIAYGVEKAVKKRTGDKERVLATRKVVVIGVFSAIAAILMVLEFPVPFAPSFYGLDFSELPALVGAFAYGPVAGVMIEFCKILIKLVLKPSSTAFVGELANFAVGCVLVLPASIIYLAKKTRRQAVLGTAVGTVLMTVFGTLFNAVYLLPKFAELYGIPLDSIIAMGTAINPAVDSVTTLVILCVAPMNLLKGGLVSLLTVLIYKKLSPILKAAGKR
ncbi:MAG: ECF transporter S component [Eubacteriales bacterium]|nr:ECF transporter S component [Eubacteriales bacterium]